MGRMGRSAAVGHCGIGACDTKGTRTNLRMRLIGLPVIAVALSLLTTGSAHAIVGALASSSRRLM